MKHFLLGIASIAFWVWIPCACLAEDSAGPQIPFDAELYNLGYDVFLANSNLHDAFYLAQKAVNMRPNDPVWRKKAALSGEWSGNFSSALEHWLFIATNTGDQEANQNARRLARQLREFRTLKRLTESDFEAGDHQGLREYVVICEALGLPEDAIVALEKQRNGPEGRYVLEQLGRIYEATSHPVNAISAWMEMAGRYGATAKLVLKAASLAYGRGDLLSAYTILNLGKRSVPPQESEYWATVSDLDWAMQDTKGALAASRILVKQGAGREADYQRLIEADRNADKTAIYDLALDGWQRYKSPAIFFALLENGIAVKRQADLLVIMKATISAGDLKTLEGFPYFWILRSQIFRSGGDSEAGLSSYREALRRFPENGGLASGYIWLLIDLDRRTELRATLKAWEGRERLLPELYESFGAAYAYLGDYRPALAYFQSRYHKMRNDPSWLATYADTLEQSGKPEAAFQERFRALHLVRKQMKLGKGLSEDDRQELIRDYARLALRVEPGDALDAVMRGLMGKKQDAISRELVAAWALTSERSDLTRLWFWRQYANLARRPGWLELSLAMEENDRPRIAQLLTQYRELLPYRDAIEGAVRVGWIGEAETLAFEEFQKNEQDHLLDQQVREIYGRQAAWVGYEMDLKEQSGVGFLEQQVSISARLTPKYTVRIDAGNSDIRHQKSDVLGAYPSSIQTIKAALSMRHEHGTAELSAGLQDGLARHLTGSLSGDWRIDSRLSLDLGLRVGASATESVPLSVGGMKDEVSLGLRNSLSPRNSLLVRFSGRTLLDQERNELGQGRSFEGEWNHRLFAAWPDIGLRLFSGFHDYSRTGKPSGKALALIPPTRSGDQAFFVPDPFLMTGLGLAVGQDGRTAYSRQWRPFGLIDLSWNSRSGPGFHYEMGLLGPIWGLDSLELGLSQDSGSFGRSDISTRLGLRYRYFFR